LHNSNGLIKFKEKKLVHNANLGWHYAMHILNFLPKIRLDMLINDLGKLTQNFSATVLCPFLQCAQTATFVIITMLT